MAQKSNTRNNVSPSLSTSGLRHWIETINTHTMMVMGRVL
jgi:hypothetical protein